MLSRYKGKLYKRFNVRKDGVLAGPFSAKSYEGHVVDPHGRLETLTVDNAVGFVAEALPAQASLRRCLWGYHAYPSYALTAYVRGELREDPLGPGERIYEVAMPKPETGVDYDERPDKLLGRSFRIIRELKPWELRRIVKDRQRSHKYQGLR